MPSEAFYNKSYPQQFGKIHKKKPVLKSLLNYVLEWTSRNIFKNNYFEGHPRTAASKVTLGSDCLGSFSGESLSKPSWLSNTTKIPERRCQTRTLAYTPSLNLTPTFSFEPTIVYKIFEINYSSHAKERTTGKLLFVFFTSFFAGFQNFHFGRKTGH